jgi:hypothetical protein
VSVANGIDAHDLSRSNNCVLTGFDRQGQGLVTTGSQNQLFLGLGRLLVVGMVDIGQDWWLRRQPH